MRLLSKRLLTAAPLCLAPLTACSDEPGPPGVLIITIDTWRADHLSAELTPNLHALAAGGLQLHNAWTPIGLTTAAHASLFTGLLPPEHGLRGNNHHGYRLDESHQTLAEQVKAQGWATGAFVSSYPAGPEGGLHQGFDTSSAPESGERPTAETVGLAQAWLGAQAGPWMMWVHTNDPHGPYAPDAADLAAVGGGDDDKARYRGEVHQADRLLGPLIAEAQARGALIIVTADHGEVHAEERCGWQHERSSSPVVLRVPLVIAGPGVPKGRRDGLVGLTDLAHTALVWAKLPPLPPSKIGGPPLDLLTGEDPSRSTWAAESGVCDPECSPGCAPAGFLGKDLVVFGADLGLYVVRPGFGEYGDQELAAVLENYSLPSEPSENPDVDQGRALGYLDQK
ncbi:sulfatase [Myxococcota bacterium]|nr:sulfatase [Myxococcota bacterium]